MTQPSRTRKVASGKPESAPIGLIATTLADAVASKSALFVATDEQRALSIAAAVQAAAPDAVVVHLPSSDALPGDRAPPSPANAGHRAAAFRRLRQAGRTPVCLVTTVEAATHLYPSPSAFDAVPPQYQVGDAFDDAGMARTLEEIGYRHVDRVDEPGDMAVRGHVVDLFPVDADTPCRIEAEDGTIVAIRTFDPVTQLGTGEREALDVGRVQEPPLGDTPCDIFAHLPDAAHFADLDLTVRRARFLALVADATRGDAPVLPVLDDAAWAVFCDRATGIAPASNASVPHFAEGKAPVRAFASWARGLMADGCRLLLVGGARDLRFLRPSRRAHSIGRAPRGRELVRGADVGCRIDDARNARRSRLARRRPRDRRCHRPAWQSRCVRGACGGLRLSGERRGRLGTRRRRGARGFRHRRDRRLGGASRRSGRRCGRRDHSRLCRRRTQAGARRRGGSDLALRCGSRCGDARQAGRIELAQAARCDRSRRSRRARGHLALWRPSAPARPRR